MRVLGFLGAEASVEDLGRGIEVRQKHALRPVGLGRFRAQTRNIYIYIHIYIYIICIYVHIDTYIHIGLWGFMVFGFWGFRV